MVLPLATAAAQAGSAGATALGLGMGKTDLDLTRDLFKMQMRQSKRLWTADYAEASVRHGEACLQSAQQHAESQALATASYIQSQRLHTHALKLACDQDSRSYEMAWRSEVREALRDELVNQNSRFNIIMLCDTVCLSCVFSLIADGSPPETTSSQMLSAYLFCLGLSITLFSVSLWCCVIVVRRLHEHTASILERKLFVQSDELQQEWQFQLSTNQPTGPQIMHLVNRAYEKWVDSYINPLGKASIHMLSMGVVAMFVTAGLLTHVRYNLEYTPGAAVWIFWSTCIVTSVTVLFMKYGEDVWEKTKQGVYDNSWQDTDKANDKSGPYAKITKSAVELNAVVGDATLQKMQSLSAQEEQERDSCSKTPALLQTVQSLRQESTRRAKTRQDVMQLLTTAAEEMDALPEDLLARLNKLLHDIDEADVRNADLLSSSSAAASASGTLPPLLAMQGSARKHQWARMPSISNKRPPMAHHPVDAQRIPVSLVALRKKLGEVALTTLLRIRNVADEPVRLKSGVKCQEGRYIQSLNMTDPHNNAVTHYLYPITEIPARSEVVIAARSNGNNWIPTSGIKGEIVYTNKKESWMFRIRFTKELVNRKCKCHVEALHVVNDDADQTENNDDDDDESDKNKNNQFQPLSNGHSNDGDIDKNNRNNHDDNDDDEDDNNEYWRINKDELDRKANNEILVTVDVKRGGDAAREYRESQVTIKAGYLLKNRPVGMRLQWLQRWFVLTPTELVYSSQKHSKERSAIPIKNITRVQPGTSSSSTDLMHPHVLEIHVASKQQRREPYKLAAPTAAERNDWIDKILNVTGLIIDDIDWSTTPLLEDDDNDELQDASVVSSTTGQGGIEIVHGKTGSTNLLPV